MITMMLYPEINNLNITKLAKIQKQIDVIDAEKSHKDEEYKLLFAQALVHFHNGNDDDALSFATASIKSKGTFYKEAQDLLDYIEKQKRDAEEEIWVKQSGFSGKIEGWLVVFALIFIFEPIGILINIFYYLPLVVNTSFMNNLAWIVGLLDPISIILITALGYNFFKKRKMTRILAIAYSSYCIIVSICCYLYLKENYDVIDKYITSEIVRYCLVSTVWIFYWIFSQRVRATFIN